MVRQMKWDRRWLEQAKLFASYSKDPSTQVGAVIVRNVNEFVMGGYNGFPVSMPDKPEWLANRELKLKYMIHAERNAINRTLVRLGGATLYVWPFMPCSKCAQLIVKEGITRVVAPASDTPRWAEDWALAKAHFIGAGVELVLWEGEV